VHDEDAADDERPAGLPEGWLRRVGVVAVGLVAAGVLLAGVLVVVLRLVVDEAVGALELADLDDYEVRFASCSVGRDGAVVTVGAFTNTADEAGAYELRILGEAGDDTVGPTLVPIPSLAPGASIAFEETIRPSGVVLAPGDDVRCRAVVYDRSPG
jgi:hypothetical protein